MAKIVSMIEKTNDDRAFHRSRQQHIEASAAALRIHALCDALEAIGGDARKWRNEVGCLR